MTLVEFLDNDPVENLTGALTVEADRIIFVGRSELIRKTEWELKNILEYRDLPGDPAFVRINPYDEDSIMDALVQILEENRDCVFDLTGGEDLVLFAFGRLYERYAARGIRLHWLNVHNGRERYVGEEETRSAEQPNLSVEENIMLHGGIIIYDDIMPNGTHEWTFDGDFLSDVERMWEICRGELRLRNYQTTLLKEIETINRGLDDDPLLLEADSGEIFSAFSRDDAYPTLIGIYPQLQRAGLLTEYTFNERFFRVRYKNEQVKRCLTKAGTILELKTYIAACALQDHDGTPVFQDGKVGVFIDWDGQVNEWWEDAGTANEVDVVMMHGLVPVFISCKNGAFSVDELYKLCTVADRFGRGYAKKILVCADESRLIGSADHFHDRAAAMGVKLITDAASLSDEAFRKSLMRAVF